MRRLADRRFGRATALVVPLLLVALAGCSSDKKSSAPGVADRPTTSARVQILSPTPFQETGPDVTVQVKLIGAKEVPQAQATGPLNPDEGHIHISLDGVIKAMAYGESQQLTGLTPGHHSVQVDFVAVDHVPFRNRVTAAVEFIVK